MATRTEARTLLTEGVLLAAVSAYIYFITFVYEYGFCRYFGIPASLISPNASTFLVASFALGVTLLPALNYLAFTTPLFKAARDPERRPYRDVYAILAVLSATGILLSVIYGISLRGIITYTVASIAILAFLFLPGLLSNRTLPVAERLSRHADIQDQDPFIPTILFDNWLSRRQIQLGLLALLSLLIANLIGDAEARKKQHFLAIKSDPDFILLRNYNDLMIFAKINKLGNQQTDDLRLLWLSEKKEIDFILRKTGPLKPFTNQDGNKKKGTDSTSQPSSHSPTPSRGSAPSPAPTARMSATASGASAASKIQK